MAWYPIVGIVYPYVAGNLNTASGYVLKAYQAGTSTNTPMATDNTGGTQVTDIVLDSNGYPSVSGTIITPHIDQSYKLALYATQAAADADTGAIWTIDNIPILTADLISTATGAGASLVSIEDAAKNYTYASVTNVEAALAMAGTKTTAEKTWYVSTTGNDTTGDGSSGTPFRTIQKAYDVMPSVILHKQTIELAAGTYNTNYLSGSPSVEYPRPAILFARGKLLANRTQKDTSTLNGAVVIKGATADPASYIIELTDTYTYGIYNAQGQIGLQDLTIKTAAAATSVNNLVTSHRAGSYVHMVDVELDGTDKNVTSVGLLTEGGGNIEWTTLSTQREIKNCAILCQATSRGDNLTVSGKWIMSVANTGVSSSNGGRVDLAASGTTGQRLHTCSSHAINIQNNSVISVTGSDDGNHISIESPVRAYHGAVLDFTWTDNTSTTDLKDGSKLFLNNSDYQDQIQSYASDIYFSNSDSFISPDTGNDSPKPVICYNGSRIYEDGTNNFNGSGGDTAYAYNGSDQTIGANGATITIPTEVDAVIRLNAAANRTSCVLAAGSYEFQRLEIFSVAGFSVEIIESTTATISNNAVKISGLGAADEYQGITFRWFQSRWREVSRSRAGA